MLQFRQLLVLFPLTFLSGAALAQDFSGTWFQRRAFEGGLSTAEFVLRQRGDRVYGTWMDSQSRMWAG